MLQTSHLTKIYKSKKGIDVKALDDVSVSFPETGMVFLLGKSGSGKSTLLNVCGGLDEPTSGEVIVKGRSSKDFTQSDFDSYRNTFIGFIFQEYNILNDFTVEENIALALELQNKPKDKEAIEELLEKVDLKGFGKRKPNTLSGGQKQRIAIARALIKKPEIIMADEPTGALDSVTGKQVLDTLKKLSKETLVIVVSHDRDFAETYADRIIELKDGKILSDVTKVQETQQSISENVTVIGDTLCIKKGSDLNEKDFSEIKNFLKSSNNDVILTKGEQDIKAFKAVSRITDDGEKEVFKDTDESKLELKKYSKEDSKFITSKLPIKHAFKIGTSSLKNKPIRLLFTVILCTVSFIMFGVLSTMTFYDSESTFKETLRNSSYSILKLNKEFKINETYYYNGQEESSYTSIGEARYTKEELSSFANKYGNDTFGTVDLNTTFNIQTSTSRYWTNQINYFGYLPLDNSLRERIDGEYPAHDDEICISSYTANVIFENKIYDSATNKILELQNPRDIIGKKITIGDKTYKVVGIIDSGVIDPKFNSIRNSEEMNYQLQYEFETVLSDGLHLAAFVTENRVNELAKEVYVYNGTDPFLNRRIATALKKADGSYDMPEWANAGYGAYSMKKESEQVVSLTSSDINLTDDQVVVSTNLFCELMMEYYNRKMNNYWSDATYADYELVSQVMQKGYYKYDEANGKSEFIKFSDEEYNNKLNQLISKYKREGIKLTIGIQLFNEMNQTTIGEIRELNVVGIWFNLDNQYQSSKLLVTDKIANELWENQKVNLVSYSESETKYTEDGGMYGTIFIPYDKSEENTQMIWDTYVDNEYKEDDSRSRLTSYIISDLEMIDGVIESFSKVFLYMGIAIAVFAILLFSNFISVSISYKKKEIGILRAVGARSSDVFKIFFSESFVITVICVLLSIVGSVILCDLLNTELAAGIGVSIFVFGIVSLALIIVIALLTAIIATVIPVYNAAKKKPVESIRAL